MSQRSFGILFTTIAVLISFGLAVLTWVVIREAEVEKNTLLVTHLIIAICVLAGLVMAMIGYGPTIIAKILLFLLRMVLVIGEFIGAGMMLIPTLFGGYGHFPIEISCGMFIGGLVICSICSVLLAGTMEEQLKNN